MSFHFWNISQGVGPPLLLLHGFTGDTSSMSLVAEHLISTRTVVSVDLPGHGKTGDSGKQSDFEFDATLDALIKTMEDNGFEKFDLLGYSMGGRLAIGLAIKYPSKINKIAVIGASAGISDDNQRLTRRKSDAYLADDISEKGIEWFVDYWMGQPMFTSQNRLEKEHLERLRVQRLGNDPKGLIKSLRGLGLASQPPLWKDLKYITSPTAIIVGEEDSKFRSIAIRLKSLIPKSEIFIVPDSGHACHLENTIFTNELLENFLSGD